MTDDDRQERNRTKLQEAHPGFRTALAAVLADLEAGGYRPRIQTCWRSPADQAAAKASGHSKLSWGYHNASAADGSPEALAADVLDDDRPLDPSRDFMLDLARAARRQRLATGIDWGVPVSIRQTLNRYIDEGGAGHDWMTTDGLPGKLGWDALHVEVTGISVAKARIWRAAIGDYMKCLLILALVLVSSRVSAQDIPFRISLVAAVAAHGADLATTEHCLGSGRCREMNPFLLRFDQPAVFGAVKMGMAALSLWGTAKLHETHPRLAVFLNVGMAGAFTAVAVRNARVSR